ncbi:hypothetical protein HELRODRAFT_126538, partial [Helobdella robusta]|uniref:TIR domain-containing protein n=1 Tax=Helobdella robusta TaxID=6412 RepID=T1EHA2_HELRO
YKVCHPDKDFIVGRLVEENIVDAICFSKRVVCFLTQNFLNSPFCMFEFEKSLQRNMEKNKERLIVLLNKSFEVDKKKLPRHMFNFLKTHTYIE